MPRRDDASHPARAIINGTTLDDEAIRGIELTRARHALACLKSKIGHDQDPWRIMLGFTSPDAAFPTAWDPAYPASERLGAIINDAEGRRISSATHETRDAEDGLHVKLTIHLPEAAPDELVTGHLRHFAVEFRNWTRMALEAV